MAESRDNSRLDAQLRRLRSDEHVRERVRRTAALPAAERLELTRALCRAAAQQLDRLSPGTRARVETWRAPLGEGAAPILRRLATTAAP